MADLTVSPAVAGAHAFAATPIGPAKPQKEEPPIIPAAEIRPQIGGQATPAPPVSGAPRLQQIA